MHNQSNLMLLSQQHKIREFFVDKMHLIWRIKPPNIVFISESIILERNPVILSFCLQEGGIINYVTQKNVSVAQAAEASLDI